MTPAEQIDAFANDIDNLVGRYCAEFELTTAAAVGTLVIKVITLVIHATGNDRGDDKYPDWLPDGDD